MLQRKSNDKIEYGGSYGDVCMKWYVEYVLLYVIVVIVLFAWGNSIWEDAAWFVSMVFGWIVTTFLYLGYSSTKKTQ